MNSAVYATVNVFIVLRGSVIRSRHLWFLFVGRFLFRRQALREFSGGNIRNINASILLHHLDKKMIVMTSCSHALFVARNRFVLWICFGLSNLNGGRKGGNVFDSSFLAGRSILCLFNFHLRK